MSNELSRREVIAIAGIGMAASACSPAGGNIADGHNVAGTQAMAIRGGIDWGENPHDAPPTGGLQHYPANFSADYAALLYLGLSSNWSVRVNHASYHIPGNHAENRENKAVAAFTRIVDSKNTFGDHLDLNPYKRKDGSFDDADFLRFRFKSATEIFIFIHQTSLVSPAATEITLDRTQLISFSPRCQEKDQHGRPKEAKRNYSFFNASIVDNLPEKLSAGKMIRLQNWARDEYGDDISAYDQTYSMNIHFTIPGDGGLKIPMIFDPDVGNGTGNEP